MLHRARRYMFMYKFSHNGARYHPRPFGRIQCLNPRQGLLDQTPSIRQQQKLLRETRRAERPQPCATPTSQDNRVEMIHYLHYLPFKTYSFAVILSAVAAALSAAKGKDLCVRRASLFAARSRDS